MGGKPVTVFLSTNKAAKIRKWKVKEGMLVSARQVIFLYDSLTSGSGGELGKYKCMQVGTVRKLIAKEGDVVHPGLVFKILILVTTSVLLLKETKNEPEVARYHFQMMELMLVCWC